MSWKWPQKIKNEAGNIINPATSEWQGESILEILEIKKNQTNWNQKIQLVDENLLNLKTEDSILRIHDTPHSSPEISVHLTKDSWISSSIAVQANKWSREIQLLDSTWFLIWDKIKIIDWVNSENDILKIININWNLITLDRVLDCDQVIGKVVRKVLINMNVDGSVTEQIFSYKPRTWERKRITWINISITTTGEPSTEKFAWIPALSRGCHFKVKNAIGRDQTYFIPFRSNASFELSDFEYIKEAKVLWWAYTTFLKSDFFQKMRTIIPLNDTQELQLIIQDDLTTILSFECKVSMYDESWIDFL
jgi:hypothetical protein